MRDWLALCRPGDWLLMALAAGVVGAGFATLWQGGFADKAIIRQNGNIFAEIDLHTARQLTVNGPLGTTLIEVQPGRIRVAADPGPRQYCVRQGWLTRPGDIAVCAPNRVSVQLAGRTRVYDALSY